MSATVFDPTAPFIDGLLSVEASAGTGKTWSITSLVTRLVVEEDVAIERFLIVTFTRAATAELVDRVRGRLAEAAAALRDRAVEVDPVLAQLRTVADDAPGGAAGALERIERALRDVDEASITTLHGFCQRVLQQATLAADAEPAVTVDSDREASLLLEEVVGDWEVALLRPAEAEFVDLLGALRLRRPALLALARTAVAEPDAALFPPPSSDGDPEATARAALADLRSAMARAGAEDVVWQEQHGVAGKKLKIGTLLERERRKVTDPLERGLVPDAATLRAHTRLVTATQAKKGITPPPSSDACARFLDRLGLVEQQLRDRFVEHVRREVPRRRRARARIGFEGLLQAVDTALDDPATRAELLGAIGGAYDAVFVDEFQDTDPVQWRVLQRLLGDTPRFVVVGDPKQAIYGWRGADLQTYLDAVGGADDQATMTTNWRSDGPYVEACNHLLDRTGVFGIDDLAYVEVGHAPGRADAGLRDGTGTARAGLHLVFHERGRDGEPVALGVGRRHVAATTAEDVVATLGGSWSVPCDDHEHAPACGCGDASVAEEDARRTVGPQDCVVLVRSNREARLVAAALRSRGVQPTLGGGQDVFAADEAAEVQHLLAALLQPARGQLVRRVLLGPFAALDASALDGLGEDDWDHWAGLLRTWHATWQRHGIAALLERAMREGGAERRLAARPDGERILTNLRHLGELLHAAAREEALGTHALLGWLRARRADADEDAGRAPVERELRLERDDEAVRVLTVHAAKGLEFPLVWAPFLWSSEVRARRIDTRGRGFVVNDPANAGRRTLVNHATSPYAKDADAPAELQQLWLAADEADWQSGLRLAYVALTRAVHRCVVDVGAFKDVRGSSVWHLVHGLAGLDPFVPGERLAAVEDDDAALLAVVEQLAEHPSITHAVVPRTPPATTRAAPDRHQDVDGLVVASWSGRSLDRAWGRTSYTSLLRRRWAPDASTATEDDARDHDEVVADPVRDAAQVPDDGRAGVAVPLAPLPRGADWGTFLHGVLEHTDFATDHDSLLALVRDQARTGSLPVDGSHHGTVVDGLLAVLRTPLGPALGDLALADVPRADRLDELRFTLALAGPDRTVSVDALAEVLDRHDGDNPGVPLAATAAHLRDGGDGPGVHGLLVGAIDLVLRETSTGAPRWWVVDYKSNGLGRTIEGRIDAVGHAAADDAPPPVGRPERRWVEVAGDHHPDRLLEAMLDHDYLLQAHLYVVALHRFLRSRLGAGYDYDAHVGGWAYLFLRGMTGADVLRTGEGQPYGVASGRPTRALVEDLDALLAPRGGAA